MRKNSSWQNVAGWYNRITEKGGHYYHQHVVIPGVIKLLDLKSKSKILDLACGNGVLAKHLPKDVFYIGVDSSSYLIKEAQKYDHNPKHKYLLNDVTKPLNLSSDFTHAAIILAIQNIRDPERVFQNAVKLLTKAGKLVIVLNHPAFRIPRQSSWGIDEKRKLQYRRIDRYMSPMTIPINTNPSDKNSKMTMSYHFPISSYSNMLKNSGFATELIEEWTSDKTSEGKAARMENRSRDEIPLFMAILATKQ